MYTTAAIHSGNTTSVYNAVPNTITSAPFPKWNPEHTVTVEAATNTAMNVTCIRVGVKDLPSGALIAKANYVEERMTANPHFPAPIPSLATLRNASTALQTAVADSLTGARNLVALRWERHVELERILVQLAKYVMATAQGDVTKQVTSGFELRRPPLRITELTAPAVLTARRLEYPDADLLLHWGAVHGARLCQVEVTTDDATAEPRWTLVHTGSSRRAHVRGLAVNLIHNFRVRAMGTAGTGPYSSVVGEKVR